MIHSSLAGLRRRLFVGASISTLAAIGLSHSAHAADPDKAVDAIKTASPIKHVIIIVGEAVLMASTALSGSAAYAECESPIAASVQIDAPTNNRRRNPASEL